MQAGAGEDRLLIERDALRRDIAVVREVVERGDYVVVVILCDSLGIAALLKAATALVVALQPRFGGGVGPSAGDFVGREGVGYGVDRLRSPIEGEDGVAF